jgi:hypothetical protein
MTPTAAERVRSILAAGSSLDIVLPELRTHVDRYEVDAHGDVTVRLPGTSPLVVAAAGAPGGALAVAVELTDVAPVAMPHRVRAQATLHAHLVVVSETDGEAVLRIHPLGAQLTEGHRYAYVDGAELSRAAPDVLATVEAALLLHLVDSHADVVDLLTRLIPVRTMQGVVAVLPRSVDRFGLVLRLRYARDEREVRLGFPAPLESAAAAGDRLRALLHRARGCRRRMTPHRDPGLSTEDI